MLWYGLTYSILSPLRAAIQQATQQTESHTMPINEQVNTSEPTTQYKAINDGFFTLDHYMIMVAIECGDNHHGYAILQHLNNDLGYIINPPKLYRKLKKLTQQGYLSIPRVNKNQRLYYTTDVGKRYMASASQDLFSLVAQTPVVSSLMAQKRNNT